MEGWLTVREAAERLNISERTLYRRIDQGLYKSKKVERGRRVVYITDDIIESSQADVSTSLSEELQKENEWLRQQVSEMSNQVKGLEAQLESERHRHDQIVTSHLSNLKLMLEAPKRGAWWKRLFKRQHSD